MSSICQYPTYDVCVTRNNPFTLQFFREVEGVLFSFTGKKVVLTVRDRIDGKEIIILSSDAGDITFSEKDSVADALVVVFVNSEKVRAWNNGHYVYDLVYFTDSEDVKTLLGGAFSISKGVSDVR